MAGRIILPIKATLGMRGQRIEDLAEPVQLTDAATKDYVDNNGGGGTEVVANPSGAGTIDLSKLQVGTTIYTIPGGGGSGDLWVDLTSGRNSAYQDSTGATVRGADATDSDGNTNARFIVITSSGTTYYRIENVTGVGVAKSAIIREGNKDTGNIVVSKTY